MPEPRIPDVDDDTPLFPAKGKRKSGIPDVDDDIPLFPAKGQGKQKNYSYHTRRQGGGRGAEKNSENYLMDMLQVVVHIQIKKQHNVLPTNPCISIIFKHHCLSNHQKHKIIMCSLVGVGQTSLLPRWTGVTLFRSAGGRPSFKFNLIVINNNFFAMALNEDTYKLLIVSNRCKLFINCFLVPVPAPKAATASR
jgi:hypothetical protein